MADEIEEDLLGRNVLAGRWTFQIVEEFDDGKFEVDDARCADGKQYDLDSDASFKLIKKALDD